MQLGYMYSNYGIVYIAVIWPDFSSPGTPLCTQVLKKPWIPL
jgi:hypothetical protein